MIQSQTILPVSDNSGAKRVKCIKVLGGFRRKFAKTGDLIAVSVQDVKQHKKKKIRVKKGEVCQALVIRTKSKLVRKNYSRLIYNDKMVVLMTNKKKPIATRVLGPVAKELRQSKFLKVALLASGFI